MKIMVINTWVGSQDSAARYFERTGVKDILERKAGGEDVPIRGISLRMQLVAEGSEEGRESRFGWIPGRLRGFQPEATGRNRFGCHTWYRTSSKVSRTSPSTRV